jgi:hypothetical protein
MANDNDEGSNQWLAIIGKSLAFLCLAQADLRDKDLATQGRFLERLGIPRTEAAKLIGTSYASLTVAFSLAAKKKGRKRGRKKKR